MGVFRGEKAAAAGPEAFAGVALGVKYAKFGSIFVTDSPESAGMVLGVEVLERWQFATGVARIRVPFL